MDQPIKASATGYVAKNPVNGEILRERASLSDAALETTLANADAAFKSWRHVGLDEKIALFRKIADLFDRDAAKIGRQISLEMGKIHPHSTFEVTIASAMFRYYADIARDVLADEEVTVPGMSKVVIRREPVGVILGIEPFNAPVYQSMRVAVPNLMLGNTVLVKPAEATAESTLMLDALFREAGFPEHVYQTTLASIAQISTLIADPRVRGVTLTGSDRAGAIVGAQAGKAIKPVVLELGGSDAFIVLDSADIEKAAGTAAVCRLIISGQACALPKRVIVTEAVADRFIPRFVELFGNQTVGDPFDAAATMGPMVSEEAALRLQAQYEDAIQKGATVLLAGGLADGKGAFFKPAVLGNVCPGMMLYDQEAFGPMGLVFRVADADAAVILANDSKYGLGGSVFAEDAAEAQRVAAALDTGSVGINAFVGAPIEIPFGGTKSSGVGRELGRTGMDQFANIKTYAVA